jgi:guanylate kinase
MSKHKEIKKGILFILSGPSGVGKGTVLDSLLQDYDGVKYSVSATTRKPRENEVDGQDYFFLSQDKFFENKEKDEFIECAKVHNNYYGTPKRYVDQSLAKGNDIILEIDIQGAKQVRERYPDAVFIFLVPPSFEELKNRLKKRDTEDNKSKKVRLKNAKKEISEVDKYDYTVENDMVDRAVKEIKDIIKIVKKQKRE